MDFWQYIKKECLKMLYKKIETENYNLEIHYDEMAGNPRYGDNLGKMVCWHRRYDLGDNHDYSIEEFKNETTKTDNIILPLYLYDHSGITIATTPFHCNWDSGQVGYIYISKEKIRREYGVKRISKKLKERVIKCLINEVQEYDCYLTGECFDFILEDKDGEEVGRCCGFYGSDFMNNGILDYLPEELQNPELYKYV